MEIKKYQDMMNWLTRPGFDNGGRVKKQGGGSMSPQFLKNILEKLPSGYSEKYIETFYDVNDKGDLVHKGGSLKNEGSLLEKEFEEEFEKAKKKGLKGNRASWNSAIKSTIKDKIVTGTAPGEKKIKQKRNKSDPGRLKRDARKLSGRTKDMNVVLHHGLNLDSPETLRSLILDENYKSKEPGVGTQWSPEEKTVRELEKKIKNLKDKKPEGWQRKSDEMMANLKRLKKGYSIPSPTVEDPKRRITLSKDQKGKFGYKADTPRGYQGLDESQTVAFKANVPNELADIPLKDMNAAQRKQSVGFIADVLAKSPIDCSQAEGGVCSPEDYKKSFNQLVQKGANGDGDAIKKLQKFSKLLKGAKTLATFTGWGILGELGFMVPFAVGDYAGGESWKRIIGNATDLGFGPMLGQSEDEEIISYLPEGSLGEEAQGVQAARDEYSSISDTDRFVKPARIGMDQGRFDRANTKAIEDSLLRKQKAEAPFLEGPRNENFNMDLYDQGMVDWTAAQEQANLAKQQTILERQKAGTIAQKDWMVGGDTRGYAGGGITRLDPRRPGALPPKSGPQPYGLPYVPYRVKKTTEY